MIREQLFPRHSMPPVPEPCRGGSKPPEKKSRPLRASICVKQIIPDPSCARRSGRRRPRRLYAQGIIESLIENQRFSLFTPLQSCIFSCVVCHNSFSHIKYNRVISSGQSPAALLLLHSPLCFPDLYHCLVDHTV